MGLTDEQYRSIGVDPRECHVPDWYKLKLEADGWKPCPEEETCSECGRYVIEGGELCCGYHLEEHKLLARDDDGSLCYPIPDKIAYIERLEEMERVISDAAEAVDNLHHNMTLNSRDWSRDKGDSWLYGIVCGWGEALVDMVEKRGWTPTGAERCHQFNLAIKRLLQAGGRAVVERLTAEPEGDTDDAEVQEG